MKLTLTLCFFVCASLTVLAVSTNGCSRREPEIIDVSLPIVTKHQLQTIKANGWQVQRWVPHLWASPADVWIRITPLDAGVKKLPDVKVQLHLTHKDPKFSRNATVQPEFQECSKMSKRREHGQWGQDTGALEDFPPKELCWETTIEDAFNSDIIKKRGATILANGAYDLDVKVILAVEGVEPFQFSPIRMEFHEKGPRYNPKGNKK